MTLKLDVTSNIKSVLKQIEDINKNQIPFATSRAMEKTVLEARDDVYKSIPLAFDRPGRQFLKKGRKTRQGVRSGWIRADWPSKRDLIKGQRGEASVYIWGGPRDTAAAKSKGSNIDEIIRRNVNGTSTRNVSLNTPVVVFGRKMIIQPSGWLLSHPKHKNEIFKLNKNGNIGALRKNIIKAKNDKRNYLVVELGGFSKNRNKDLPPGIYRKVYTDYKYKQQPRTSRGRLQRASKLIKILTFARIRKHKKKWDFPSIVNRSYDKSFTGHFRREFREAVRTAKPRRR